MRYLLPILAVALLLGVACNPVTVGTPTVTTTLVTSDTLRLSWTAVSGASGYYVYLDGTKNTVSTTSFDVTSPTKLIEVSSYNSSNESDKWQLYTGVEKTSNLTVDDIGGAGPNFAFYFNSSGDAIAIPLDQGSTIDFVLDTTNGGPQLASPDVYSPPYNSKDDGAIAASTTDFDGYIDAASPTAGYTTLLALSNGALYALWIDPTNNGWSADDHFAKMKVENVSGNTLTLTFGYQTVAGLRWLENK